MPKPAAYVPMAAKGVHVKLRSDVDRRVQQLADLEGNPKWAVVRRLIAEALGATGDAGSAPTGSRGR